MNFRVMLAILSVTTGLGAGCSSGPGSSKLGTDAFYGSARPATQPAAQAETPREAQAAPTADTAAPRQTSAAVGVIKASDVPAGKPTTVGASTGGFFYVGAVVAEANGRPVYTDKILRDLDATLATKASQLEAPKFREVARDLVFRTTMGEINNELEFAAAQRNLAEEDEQLAKAITTVWRTKRITEHGGSVAETRAAYAKTGEDFEDRVAQQYKEHMIRIYYERKVFPRVQVTADDMRQFYNQNVAKFTENERVVFRAIRIGVRERATRQRALDVMNDIYQSAKNGDDFGKLAGSRNDNRTWMGQGGYPLLDNEIVKGADDKPVVGADGKPVTRSVGGWVDRGALQNLPADVEKAAFALKPGEMSEIIDTGDAFFLVKVEKRQAGRVHVFDAAETQQIVRRTMESEQRSELRKKEQMKLQRGAVWRLDEKMIDLATDAAMQKYAIWARARAQASDVK